MESHLPLLVQELLYSASLLPTVSNELRNYCGHFEPFGSLSKTLDGGLLRHIGP